MIMRLRSTDKAVFVVIGIVIAVPRLFVRPSDPDIVDIYKDFVHVFMGILAVGAWKESGVYRNLFWLLCVWEVAVAILTRL